MESEIRDPTGDTGTGEDITEIGTRRHKTAQDLVADVVEVETGKTAEAVVRERAMFQTPTPPHQDGQKTRGGEQTGGEGGRLSYMEQWIWGMGKHP